MPLTVPVLRVLEARCGPRTDGPLILRPTSGKPGRPPRRIPDGAPDRQDRRHPATHQPALPAPRSDHQLPPTPEFSSETHRSWPATPTPHYDRARGNLNRHGVHFPHRQRRRRLTCVRSTQKDAWTTCAVVTGTHHLRRYDRDQSTVSFVQIGGACCVSSSREAGYRRRASPSVATRAVRALYLCRSAVRVLPASGTGRRGGSGQVIRQGDSPWPDDFAVGPYGSRLRSLRLCSAFLRWR